jgi:predicted RNase H-like HicB family nuclease
MKNLQTEVCWSEEDLAYLAWVPGRPGCKARGESPAQALERLQSTVLQTMGASEEVPAVPELASPEAAKTPKRREHPKITRLEAASRQLDAAIKLFFAGADPLAVHALATAAGELFADRVARWNGKAAGDSLPRETYLRTLRQARELLRSCGGEEALELDASRNDDLIAQAIGDRLAACPSRPLTQDMAAFRDWYRAARTPEVLTEIPAPSLPSRRARGRPSLQYGAVQFSLLP